VTAFSGLTLGISACCGLTGFGLGFAARRRLQPNTSATCFRQPDCNGLFGGAGAMLTTADMVYFFTHKFARLSTRCLALVLGSTGSLHSFLFRHEGLLS
jgi:hypothetical protein